MSKDVVLNGILYVIPETGEIGWGQQVTNYLVALGSGGVLSLEGGDFPLLNEINFGPNFGLASPYFRSGLDPAALDGVLRLTNLETVSWRNSTDTADLPLHIIGDQLWFGAKELSGGTQSPLTTKGDIYTYSSDNARLPVGLNGQVLTADNSTPTGLVWGAGGGGGGGSLTEQFTTTAAVNALQFNVTKFTLVSNTTIPKPTSIPNGVAYTITYYISQAAASSFTVTWFSGIKWKYGILPIMTTTFNAVDTYVLTTFDGGTNWVGTPVQGYM
jgi:hypothetical protein